MTVSRLIFSGMLAAPLFFLMLLLPAIAVSSSAVTISDLGMIHAPDEYENIHVQALSSDTHASEFLIFVKKGVPLHRHLKHSETIYVLEGEAEMQLGDVRIKLQKGSFIKVPQGLAHGVVVRSSTALKVLSVQAPEFLGKDRVSAE